MIRYSILIIFFSISCDYGIYFGDVIKHYSKNPGDSLKLKAARYLIENSKYHYGQVIYLSDKNGNKVDDVNPGLFCSRENYKIWLDSMEYRMFTGEFISDQKALTSAYLIENIDMAFEVWQKPWAKHICFNDFCEYILPYRAKNEMLCDWRKYFYNEYIAALDSNFNEGCSTIEVAEYYLTLLEKKLEYHRNNIMPYNGNLIPEEVEKLKYVSCLDLGHYVTLAMRAVGIPVSLVNINWRVVNRNHFTNFIYSNDSARIYKLSLYDEKQQIGIGKDKSISFFTSKTTFAPDLEALKVLKDKKDKIPVSLFYPYNREDITNIHCVTFDLKMKIPEEFKKEEFIYLCRFVDMNWIPIRCGKAKGDSAIFKNSTIQQLYRLGKYENGKTTTVGELFTLGEKGDIEYLPPSKDYMKYVREFYCKNNESNMNKVFYIYYWDENLSWKTIKGFGQLWGKTENGNKAYLMQENNRDSLIPYFYKAEFNVPSTSVILLDGNSRPIQLRKGENTDYTAYIY